MRHKTALFAFLFLAAVFALSTLATKPALASTEKILHAFTAFPNGDSPSQLVADAAGNFYGVALGGRYAAGVVYRLVPQSNGKVTETVLYNFTGGLDGNYPTGIVLDPKGNIYGFTEAGGANQIGTFFELTPTKSGEWKETVLYNFADTGIEYQFNAAPSLDRHGHFFGQTYDWGPTYGYVFELVQSKGIWSEKIIHTFTGEADGGDSFGQFAFDDAGNLYGTGLVGGASKHGVVFELSLSGSNWTEQVIYNFTGGTDGASPEAGVIFDKQGNLYGTTDEGGASPDCESQVGCGTVFELQPAGNGLWSESVLYSFNSIHESPVSPGGLSIDNAGNLFGTTYYGGSGNCSNGCGTAYELSPTTTGTWTQTVISNFAVQPGGYNPSGGIVFGSGGRLFGTTSLGGLAGELNGTIFEATPESNGSWNVTIPYAFPTTDGDVSQSTLIEDAEGNLYGTTAEGGLWNVGTVFKLSPTSSGFKEQILFTFVGSFYGSATGSYPSAGLVMDSSGNLYGTTFDGGANNLGTVFELSPAANGQWTETILYSFAGGDGAQNPMASLVFDSAGNLYGTTEYGGPHAYGAVFKLSPGTNGTWTESVIHAFAGYPADGAHPAASLVFDGKGNLYGTTTTGGSGANCKFNQKPEGCGVVFELSPNANGPWTETLLHSFTITGDDGAFPYANVIFDDAGNLYGTTEQGGVSGQCKVQQLSTCGTVFELTPSGTGTWTEKVLYAFKGLATDGALPFAGLVMDAAGNLYGTTDVGGNASNPQYDQGFGTVFELSPTSGGKWTESVLHNFQLVSDGALPQSGLLLDSSGSLFGATTGTASNNGSVVFEITP